MPKIDLRKQLGGLYKASATKLALVEVPPMSFLTAQGEGAAE